MSTEAKHTPWAMVGREGAYTGECLIERADGSGFAVTCTDDEARLIAAAPELLEQAKLFERCIIYEIGVAEKRDDDEGARLKSLTLHLLREVLAKAGAA